MLTSPDHAPPLYSIRMMAGGVIDHEKGDAATVLVPRWSFTKTVITICALRLVEESWLDLHAALPGRPYSLHQ